MDSSLLVAGVIVAIVIVIGLVLRRASGGSDAMAVPRVPEMDTPRSDAGPEDFGADDDHDGGEAVAVTSDGYSFYPDVHAVRLVPPAEDEDAAWAAASREGGGGRNRRGDAAFGASLHAGDLTGVRVVRGGADDSPWLLETLGRDGEYLPWGFEARDAAEAAQALLEGKRIVHTLDNQGERRIPPSREAWEEAKRIWEETQADLAMDDPDEDPR